jgi:hypothetical protein
MLFLLSIKSDFEAGGNQFVFIFREQLGLDAVS